LYNFTDPSGRTVPAPVVIEDDVLATAIRGQTGVDPRSLPETSEERARNAEAVAQAERELGADALRIAARAQARRVEGLDRADHESLSFAIMRRMIRAADDVIAEWRRERAAAEEPSS
jgi:hypothetical protein